MAKVNIAANSLSRPRRFRRCPHSWHEFAIALGVLVLLSASSSAQNTHPTGPQVEAAYLYNFGKFVTWPSDRAATSDVLEICVLGRDPFGEVLDSTVMGESINHKKVSVQRLASMQSAFSCSILYVSSSEENHLAPIVADAQRMGLLTVSDIKHFAERGGVIGLVTQDGRIRFEVNLNAAGKTHLLLSSELLKVATRVIPEKAAGN